MDEPGRNGETESPPSQSVDRLPPLLDRVRHWWRDRRESAGRNGRRRTGELLEQVTTRLSEMHDVLQADHDSAERTEHTVKDLVTAFDGLSAQCREQSEHLNQLATSGAEAAQRRTDQLASVIENLGNAAASQAARMEEIARNLKQSGQASDEMREAMTSLNKAVEQLAERSGQHDETIQRLDMHAGIRERTLTDMIEAQNKRFGTLMWLVVAAMSLSIIMELFQFLVLTRHLTPS